MVLSHRQFRQTRRHDDLFGDAHLDTVSSEEFDVLILIHHVPSPQLAGPTVGISVAVQDAECVLIILTPSVSGNYC